MSDRCDCCGEFEHLKRIDALVAVLKREIPKLVVEAVNALKPELPKLVPNLSDAEWETLKRKEDQRRERVKVMTWSIKFDRWLKIRRGDGRSTWGAVWIDLGRLRLIRCAPEHPNKWMIVWGRGLPGWNPQTYWIGSEKPGRYWRGCDARLQRARGVDHEDAVCRFPKCDCPPPSPEVIEELKALAKAKRTS